MKRSKFSLSHYRLLTCDMGKLVPVACYHVLPGDTIQQASSLLIRVSPLLAPVMHPVSVRLHHWFVPYRVMWDGWEDFITGVGSDPPPMVTGTGTNNGEGSLWDYLGLPPGQNLTVNAFAFEAYNKIFDEFYRDQDLTVERSLNDMSLGTVCWEKDYFSAARPWPQKGPDVTLPLGVSAPVVSSGGGAPTLGNGTDTLGFVSVNTANASMAHWNQAATVTGAMTWVNPALRADLTSATAVNINDVRRAFAIQRWQEARAQYGSRYTEYLAYLGVRSSDARLQRPEYLGGGKATISFSEVLKTGAVEDPSEPIGTLKGHGISAMRSRRFRRFFEEHGVVLSLLSVRPRVMYQDGVHREWFKQVKEDFWQRELELMGQQEISNREIYSAGASPTGVFGYGDRYSEYRHHPSGVSGDFRTTLSHWHLARQFASQPALNQSFVLCDPSKRVFAEQTKHSLWCMVSHSIQSRRLVTGQTIGKVI